MQVRINEPSMLEHDHLHNKDQSAKDVFSNLFHEKQEEKNEREKLWEILERDFEYNSSRIVVSTKERRCCWKRKGFRTKRRDMMEKKKFACSIHPDHKPKIIWDVVIISIVVFNSIMIPLDVAFNVSTLAL